MRTIRPPISSLSINTPLRQSTFFAARTLRRPTLKDVDGALPSAGRKMKDLITLLSRTLQVDARVGKEEVDHPGHSCRRIPQAYGDAAAERVRHDDVGPVLRDGELSDADDVLRHQEISRL